MRHSFDQLQEDLNARDVTEQAGSSVHADAADEVNPVVLADYPARHFHAGDIVKLRYGRSTARFFVAWVGKWGTPHESHVGLQNIQFGQHVWDIEIRTTRQERGLADRKTGRQLKISPV